MVVVLSLWALVSEHWEAWEAARVELTQPAEQDERLAGPIEQRVVDVLVESTNTEPAVGLTTRMETPAHTSVGRVVGLVRNQPERRFEFGDPQQS